MSLMRYYKSIHYFDSGKLLSGEYFMFYTVVIQSFLLCLYCQELWFIKSFYNFWIVIPLGIHILLYMNSIAPNVAKRNVPNDNNAYQWCQPPWETLKNYSELRILKSYCFVLVCAKTDKSHNFLQARGVAENSSFDEPKCSSSDLFELWIEVIAFDSKH